MTANLVPLPSAGQRYSRDQLELVKRTLMPRGASDDELALFVGTANRMGLDPFAQQIRAIRRKEWNADTNQMESKISIEPGIDGFRLVAHRTGEVEAQLGPYWCGPDGKWLDAWLSETPPAAARFGVLRKGYREPRWAVALWREYRQTKRDGGVTRMWTDRPAGQLAKCAEALAWRATFPHELGGVYTTDEMAQADRDEPEATISRFAVVEGGIPSEETIRALESVAAAKELVTREIVADRYREAVKVAEVEAFGEVWEDFWRHANLASWVTVLLDAHRATTPRAIETSDPAAAPPREPAGSDLTSAAAGRQAPAPERGDPGKAAADPNASEAGPRGNDATQAGREPPESAAPTSPTPPASPGDGGDNKAGRGRKAGRVAMLGKADALADPPPAGPTHAEQAEQAAFDQAHADDTEPGEFAR